MASNYEISRKLVGEMEEKISDVNDELNESLSRFNGLLRKAKKPEEIKKEINGIRQECMKISDGLNALDVDPLKLEHTITYISELGCWVDELREHLIAANALINERSYSNLFERLKGRLEKLRAPLKRISECSNTSLSDRELEEVYIKIGGLKKRAFLIKQELGKLRKKMGGTNDGRTKGMASALKALRGMVGQLKSNTLSVRDALMTAKAGKGIREAERKVIHLLTKEDKGRLTVDRKHVVFRYPKGEVCIDFSRDVEYVLFNLFNHKEIRDGIRNIRKGSMIVASFERVISTPSETVLSMIVGERRASGKYIKYAPHCFNFSVQRAVA